MRVKTAEYNLFSLEHELRDSLRRLEAFDGMRPPRPNAYIDRWFAPQAAAELVFYRSLIDDYEHADVLRVVLTRAARSARRTTHFDLDFPREPQIEEYWCHKHRKTAVRSSAPSTSCAATPSTRSRGSATSRACARGNLWPRSCTATPASSISAARSTASSPRRRTRD